MENKIKNKKTETFGGSASYASAIDTANGLVDNGKAVNTNENAISKIIEDDSYSNSSDEANDTVVANTETNNTVEEVSAEVAKLTVWTKKTSGAQRRNVAKRNRKLKPKVEIFINKNMQNVTEVKDQSTPTSSEVAKRVRSPEEENIAESKKTKKGSPSTRSAALSKSDLGQEGFNMENSQPKTDGKVMDTGEMAAATAESSLNVGSSNKRRQRSVKMKPGANTGTERPTSYAKVARRSVMDELCYAVIDLNNPSGKILAVQRQLLEEALFGCILKYVMEADDASTIQINSHRFSTDVFMLQLASDSCIEILRNLVKDMPAPWEGAKLALVSKAEIPSLTKSSCFIKGQGGKLATEEIFKILGKQNKELNVGNWDTFHRKESPEGTLLIVGMDHKSMASLKKTKGKAFFIFQAVYFKVGKNTIGWEKADARRRDGHEVDNATVTVTNIVEEDATTSGEGESEMAHSQEEPFLAD